MRTPHTVLVINYIADDGKSVIVTHERDGTFAVSEQVTTWARECAADFWKKLREKEDKES